MLNEKGPPMTIFSNRTEAGEKLAEKLKEFAGKPDVVVAGLARGGVETAAAIAEVLKVPVDFVAVRKLGAPGQEELGIGAIAEDGAKVLNKPLIESMGIPKSYLEDIEAKERRELEKRIKLYREHHPAVDMKDKVVILADDGIATGSTMEAAIQTARKRQAKKVIVAVPVMPADVVSAFTKLADQLIFLESPEEFYAIGAFYYSFPQLDHDDVIGLLKQGLKKL